MDREEAIISAKVYAEEVKKSLNPNVIIMYGSYAKNTAHKDSDIDIAVIFNGYDGNWLKDSALLWRLTRHTNIDIEPVLLDSTNDKSGFVNEIMKTGIIIG